MSNWQGLLLYHNLESKESKMILEDISMIFYFVVLPDHRIVSSHQGGIIKIWTCDYQLEFEIPSPMHNPKIFVVSNDKVVLYGEEMYIWDLKDTFIKLEDHSDSIRCLVTYKDKLVTGSRDCNIRIWNTKTGICEVILKGHTKIVNNLIVYQNLIISNSADKTIRIWKDDLCIKIIDVGCLSRIIAVNNMIVGYGVVGKTLMIWNIEDGNLINTLEGHTSYIHNIKVLPNNDIISCARDETMRIWNLCSFQCIRVWNTNEHMNNILAVLENQVIINGPMRLTSYQ